MIVTLIEKVYSFLWGDLLKIPLPGGSSLGISLLILLLIPTGIYFTIRTRCLPIRLFPDMLKALVEKNGKDDRSSLSSFQTLIVSTATRVGMGNLVGVVAAVSAGGAGAVFWMWVTAGLSGMNLLQNAMDYHLGKFGVIFIAVTLFMFSFSTFLGILFYARSNVAYLFGDKWCWQTAYKILALVMLFIGGIAAYTFVWDLGDVGIGLMTIFNILVLYPLAPKALGELKEYEAGRVKRGTGHKVSGSNIDK